MPPPPPVAEVGAAYADEQAALSRAAVALVDAAARERLAADPGQWRDAVADRGPQLLALQQAAVERVDPFLTSVLVAQGADPEADGGALNPAAFVDQTDGGGSWLRNLVYAPPSAYQDAIAAGAGATLAASRARYVANAIALSAMQDVPRSAVTTGMRARRRVKGYVRVLRGKTCGRCAILAGRKYFVEAFRRHPRCLPAGVVVSGPATLAASRRWYEGELTVIRTASGKKLSITGNHPVLTSRGWVPAHLVLEGDDVVGRPAGDRAVGLLAPCENQVPARIEDVWRASDVRSLARMPVAPEDFHGDGADGHVDVVLPHGLLGDGATPSLFQEMREALLARGAEAAIAFSNSGANFEFAGSRSRASASRMGVGDLALALLGSHAAGPQETSLAAVSNLDARLLEASAYGSSIDAELLGERVLALTSDVGGDERFDVEREVSTRWDAPAAPFTMQSRAAYARIGEDLHLRLADQVALDRVVQASRVHWSGHVYNLTSTEGWYCADGIIVSNCDCYHVPVAESIDGDWTSSPRAYFRSLSGAEQQQVFGQAGAEAIRNGADLSQVVNAEQGVATVGGLHVTTTGTTTRGLAGQRLDGAPRLMPDEIFALAEREGWTREQTLAELHRHAYLV